SRRTWASPSSDLSPRLLVELRRLEPPARDLGHQLTRRAETLDEDLHEPVEERRCRAWVHLDEVREVVPVERQQRGLRLGLDGGRARRAIKEAHLSEEVTGPEPGEH